MTSLNPTAAKPSWLSSDAQAAQLQPQLLAKYRVFMQQLWANPELPARLADMCRLRIAAIHGCEAELAWRHPTSDISDGELTALRKNQLASFTVVERSALALAERIPMQHNAITDDQVQQLRQALGNAGTVALVTACAFFDVNCRLQLSTGLNPTTVSQQG